jgi:hypothetical protein
MINATISISKNLTCIKQVGSFTTVNNYKLTDLSKVVNGIENLKITSQAIKQSKLDKYINVLTQKGFTLISTDWAVNCGFEGHNLDVINVSLNFKK